LPPWPGPRRARRGLFVVHAKVVPDRVIRRRSIRMICAGPPVPAACCATAAGPWWPRPRTPTTRFGWKTLTPGWRTADRGVEELTGRDIVACLAAAR
jgi:hypothetical protein